MSWHDRKRFRSYDLGDDHRPGGPSEVPLKDTKRPGGSGAGRADTWTRRPSETPRPGRRGPR
jgi:hypothetical protein